MIKILLVDDQSIIREGLSSLLQAKPDLEVIGEAENGQVAVDLALKLQPDIILMDVRMPIMDGVAATRSLSQQLPQTKVLVLTTFDDDEYITKAIQNGAKGYLLKDTPSEELAETIRAVYKGYTQFGPGLFEKAMVSHASEFSQTAYKEPPAEFKQLTPRELEVLNLIGKGYSNREISQTLYITERTVKNHVSSLLGRLNLRDRTQAALLAATLDPECFH
ncbi:MAG: response regulator transcription factor [Cyanobacteria bacterium J06592_8]